MSAPENLYRRFVDAGDGVDEALAMLAQVRVWIAEINEGMRADREALAEIKEELEFSRAMLYVEVDDEGLST